MQKERWKRLHEGHEALERQVQTCQDVAQETSTQLAALAQDRDQLAGERAELHAQLEAAHRCPPLTYSCRLSSKLVALL